MTATATRSRRRQATKTPGRKVFGLSLPAATVAVTVGLGLSGGTYALWSSLDVFQGGAVTAGDLQLTATGAQTWERVSEPAGPISASEPIITVPGDVIRVVTPVASFLRGDNMVAGYRPSLAETAGSDANVAVTLAVYDGTTKIAGPVALDELLEVPDLLGTNAGVYHNHNLVVEIEVLGDLLWTHQLQPETPTLDYAMWLGGDLLIELIQVREGQGFEATS